MKLSKKRLAAIGYDIVTDSHGDIGFVYNGRDATEERTEAWETIRDRIENGLGYTQAETYRLMEKLGDEMFLINVLTCIVAD